MAGNAKFTTKDGSTVTFKLADDGPNIVGNLLRDYTAKAAEKSEADTLEKLRKDPFVDWETRTESLRPASASGLTIPGDEPLVVGKWYAVYTIDQQPVINSPHKDYDNFNYTEEHYHLDSRFIEGVRCGTEIRYAKDQWSVLRGQLEPEPKVPALMPFKCVRSTPVEWSADQEMLDKAGMIMASTYAEIANRKAVCGKCPHRGMPIQGGVCTGHRTRWQEDGTCEFKPPFKCTIEQTGDSAIIEPANIQIQLSQKFHGHPTLIVTDADGREVLRCTLKSYYNGLAGEYLVMKDTYFGIAEEKLAKEVVRHP